MTAKRIRTISNPVLDRSLAVNLRLELDPHYLASARDAIKNTQAQPHVLRNVLDWQKNRSLRS